MNSFSSCNATVQSYVFNLTSSYADQRNEATMVATSVVMFSLATLFFNLNLFSRPSDISAILNPSVRLFLRTSLSLFLPVMSYLFSEAKNKGATTAAAGPMIDELSLRARVILIWMILVELLRKKAEAILGGMQGWTGTIERASRIAWLGYLRSLYGILWVFVAAKLVQRVVTLELAKRSFAYGKNPALVTSYMAQILKEEQHAGSSHAGPSPSGSELLKRCNYVVAGEEDLVKKAGPHGYDLQPERLMEDITKVDSTVITVGKIWRLAETDKLLRGDSRLKRLCLSFALFKLLRRRLEDFPITDAEAQNCRGLIFRGLCQQGREPAAALQVFNDEVQFLCEYHHSVNPVVLASPFFFLANYILFPIVVWAICVFVIILCSNGDVAYAFHSFSGDNYAISFGLMKMYGCILGEVGTSPQNLFSTVDISITILLFLSVAYEEVWEFFLLLLSNWLMVSLLCSYASFPPGSWIRRILWVRNMLSHPSVSLKQFSLLWFCRFSMALPTKAMPIEAKKAIMDRLARVSDAAPLSNGSSVLPRSDHDLSKACESDSIAEVILTWHIATAVLEAEHPVTKPAKPGSSRKVATALSRYCAYLVAFQPELLPDDKDGTERVYKEMTEELKKKIWCPWYYCSGVRARARKLKEIIPPQGQAATTPLLKGAKLGKILSDRHTGAAADHVWKLLADLWTEVMVYAAPTGSELHAKAHKEALAQGGEFITVLWALTTHTGIAREPPVVPTTHTGIARVPPPESV
ncbi:hypothetical protein HU200_056460 [Digitaria exilis]|uniref:DUF4220 domain-containing protein n=1 Tax=Digitaria exilis TaxID=1010633 RepID=A0A835E2H9_9POAL|nr:hypothetical protein HU200_056460 [Digitaria exilis]